MNGIKRFIIETDFGVHSFEVVNDFPDKFVVWNIGRENFPVLGYIPLCKLFNGYNVDVTQLKALFVGSEQRAKKIAQLAGKHQFKKKDFLKFMEDLDEQKGE